MSTESLDHLPPRETANDHLLPIAQMVLRLLGVYFFVAGASFCIEDLAGMVKEWRMDVDLYGRGMLLDYFFPARFYGNAFYCLAGLYLMISGRWVLENVFSAARARPEADEIIDLEEPDEIRRE